MPRRAAIEKFTPAEVARDFGCSERRVRQIARRLGACRVIGRTMLFGHDDVERLFEAMFPERALIARQAARIRELEKREAERELARLRPPSGRGFVYFVHCNGMVKIGFAVDVARRIKTLQTGSAHKLTVLRVEAAAPDDESDLHERFASLRVNGEWFRYAGELKAFLEAKH